MEAARVAALREHEVVLYDEDDSLGGQLRLAAVPPYKNELHACMQSDESGGMDSEEVEGSQGLDQGPPRG